MRRAPHKPTEIGNVPGKARIGPCVAPVILMTIHAALTYGQPAANSSLTIEATMVDGTRVQFTLTKTETDKGTVREKRWKKDSDPVKDKATFEQTDKLYDIKRKSDGTKLVAKADVLLKDPALTFVFNSPEASKYAKQELKSPTILLIVEGTSFGLYDRTTVYLVTEKEQAKLFDFLKNANFPEMAN